MENNKRVEDVGKLTNPRKKAVLVMYENPVRVQTPKDILRLDCKVVLNVSGVFKNNKLVGGRKVFESKS